MLIIYDFKIRNKNKLHYKYSIIHIKNILVTAALWALITADCCPLFAFQTLTVVSADAVIATSYIKTFTLFRKILSLKQLQIIFLQTVKNYYKAVLN